MIETAVAPMTANIACLSTYFAGQITPMASDSTVQAAATHGPRSTCLGRLDSTDSDRM